MKKAKQDAAVNRRVNQSMAKHQKSMPKMKMTRAQEAVMIEHKRKSRMN